MNWSKCKTIFICFFLVIDVILAATLIYVNFSDSYVPKKEMEAISQYLSKQHIEVPTNVIPRWIPKMKNYELMNVLRSDSPLIIQFNPHKDREMLLENKTYTSDKKTITIENNYFWYQDKSAFKNQVLSEKNVTTKVKNYLSALGFDFYNITIDPVQFKNNTYTFAIHKLLSHTPLGESKLSITISGSSLSVSGIWFNPIIHDSYSKVEPRSVTDILVMFSRDIVKSNDKNVQITGIHLVYHIDSIDSYHRTFTASCMWQIETNQNKTYFYDARS